MKKRNKFLALGLCAALATTTLAGCGGSAGGGGGDNAGGNGGGGDAGGKLTVAIWDNGQQPGLQEILNDFSAATGIETQLQVIEWSSYWTLWKQALPAATCPTYSGCILMRRSAICPTAFC